MHTHGDWSWTDVEAPMGRWKLFTRSAEFLITLFLLFYAVTFLVDGDTVSRLAAFRWARTITGNSDTPWAIGSVMLSILAPLAVAFNDGRLRLLNLLLQGGFFILLGLSAFVHARTGLLWGTFLASGGWSLWRAIEIAWPHVVLTTRELHTLYRELEKRG